MATFTDDWDSDLSSDSTDAIQIDDYINKTRTDIEERLKEWIYGFVNGENDGVGGLIFAKFKEQSGDQTTAASVLGLYAKDDSGTCLYARPESSGTAVKILNPSAQIPAGAYAADSIDEDDIQLANNAALTAKDAAGTGTVNLILAGTNDLPTLPDSAEMASNAAPVEDEAIANKKYVDDLKIVPAKITNTFGSWTNKDSGGVNNLVKDIVYKVGSDGFVTSTGSSSRTLEMSTDGNNPPTTKRQENTGAGSLMIPVRKDDYWRVALGTETPTIYWLPIGSGTCVKQ